MPIYEYQCGACGHRLESFQKMTDKPLTDCPNCHGQQLQKLISAAGFQLKGTGWYATDFKNKGKKEAADTKQKSITENSNTKDNKTDSSTSSSTDGEK